MVESEEIRPADFAARAAALDTQDSCIVEAPAGSGKTELLAQRFLHLLSEVDSPEQILAITFTRAATAEMRGRILERLESAMQSDTADDPSLEPARRALAHAKSQGWELLKNPALLRIETIDSFCLALAHRTPLLARLGGAFQPTESAAPLYTLAARRTLQKLGAAKSDLTEAVAALLGLRDNSITECAELLADMLARRDQWHNAFVLVQEDDWQEKVRLELERPMARAIRRVLEKLEGMLANALTVGTQFAQLASFARDNLSLPENERQAGFLKKITAHSDVGNFPPANEDFVDAWRSVASFLLTNEGTWRKSVNTTNGFPVGSDSEKSSFKAMVARLDAIPGLRETLHEVKDLPPAHYTDKQWALLRKLFVTLRWANGELNAIFSEANTVDFVEIGLAAERVLNRQDEVLGEIPSEFALATSDHFKHLLVDEFQDTSRRQQRLLSMLVRGWAAEEGRTCFLVGDPMQSIYLFRQAEVELFHQTSKYGLGSGEESLPLTKLTLTTNFRSDRGVVDPLNDLFGPIFAQRAKADAAPVTFAPSQSSDITLRPNNVHVVPHLIAPPEPGQDSTRSSEQAQQSEAEQVVAIIARHRAPIEEALRTNGTYRVAVLARARQHLVAIAHALRQAGIPFRAIEMENLSERQEVRDLTSLLRALMHPMDRVAWLAVLRAPWCGLTLADLHQLCGADDKLLARKPMLELLGTRINVLSADGIRRALKTRAVLEEAMHLRYEHPSSQTLAGWMERVWHSLGGPDCVDATGYENAHVFFSMLEELSASGIECVGDELGERLAKLFAQPDPAASETAGVQLMTIHKAKGLGFEVVIVPGLDRKPRADKTRLLSWLERAIPADELSADDVRESEILVAPIGGKGDDPDTLTKWVKKQESLRITEERKRLFYVACTRARHELHLLATVQVQEKRDRKTDVSAYKIKSPEAFSLLKTAWPSLEPYFTQALNAWRAERLAAASTQDNLMKFPIQRSLWDDVAVDLAAGEDRPCVLRRLPDGFTAAIPRKNVTVADAYSAESTVEDLFARPAGSIRARAFGIAVHALLARAARWMEEGRGTGGTIHALTRSKRSIENLLKSEGVSTSLAASLSGDVIQAVSQALEDQAGRWILSPQQDAENEAAWTGWLKGALRSVRADRVFRAGETMGAPGDDVYWIIDYKTASHSESTLEAFLDQEKVEYKPQLEAYAEFLRLLKGPDVRIHVGLYYPLLRRLESWSV